MHQKNTAIIIPARMGSTRFPGKPLANIAGKPMIVHVVERALAADIGDVWVATCEQEIVDVVENAGGRAVMTDPELPSGSDRIYQALQKIAQRYDYIINVQGDLPTLEPKVIQTTLSLLQQSKADIATLVAIISREEEKNNPNVVKAVVAGEPDIGHHGRALYFTRATAPYGEGKLYHHIGLYGYTQAALERFVSLQPSALERREKLEQLRALENGLHIEVGVVNSVPLGVDVPEDVGRAEKILDA